MNMPFLTMQALLGTDKRPPELPAAASPATTFNGRLFFADRKSVV